MSFFTIFLREKLDAQQIYGDLKGKFETRFDVDGHTYAFLATSIAGDCQDDADWYLEFENIKSHRIGSYDINKKIPKAFAEAVDQWIKERKPLCFYTYGSEIDSIKDILEAVRKKVKGYNVIDDTADKKNEENGEKIEGNPLGKIKWTKMIPQEAVNSEDLANTKSIEFEKTYDEPNDIKTPKKYMTYKKDDKLDKGDKAYDLKTESTSPKKIGKIIEQDETLEEALSADELIKKSKSVIKKFKDKFGDAFKKAIEVASDTESLKSWMDENKEDFLTALEMVKHMVDKKEISFKEEILRGVHLTESILDLFAKKTPNALIAAAIILMATGAGNRSFAKNKAEEAFSKAKENVEKIANIIKAMSGEFVDNAKKEVKDNVDKAKENIPSGEVVDKVKDKTDDVRQGFKKFIQKKKEEKENREREIPVRPSPKPTPNMMDI